MKKAILVAIIGAMTLGVNAGDWGKAPVVDKTPIEECVDIGGSITVAYDTDYVFYGQRFTRDNIWTDVNYNIDTAIAPLNVGFYYLDGIQDDYDELGIYVSTELGTYLGFDASLTYFHYFFPSGGASNGDLTLGLSRSLGIVDFSVSATSSLGISNADYQYYEAGIEKAFEVTDTLDLVVGVGLAYDDGYKGVSDLSHYYVTAALPIELNCRATLTPYVAYQGAPTGWAADIAATGSGTDATEGQGDILRGGVSLSVSF
ncbi:MAG: hypothetical protein ACPGFB_07000 [Verrucomicrobiales bacterium]